MYPFFLLFLALPIILGNTESTQFSNSSLCSLTLRSGIAQCYDIGADRFCCSLSCQDKSYGQRCCLDEKKGWDGQLPTCALNSKDLPWCRMIVRSGYASCGAIPNGPLTCLFVCDGKGQINHCSAGRGWTKELPRCVSSVKVNKPCSLMIRNGSAVCEESSSGRIACSVICDDQPQGFYDCSEDGGWNRELPRCVSDLRESDQMCRLLLKNGTAACHDEGEGEIACSVLCEGKFQGLYRCLEGRGWDKALPSCISGV